jgi:outer membrane protein TolC
VAELDVLRAEVARDNERTNVINATSRRRVAEARLRRLLGVEDGTPIMLTSRLDANDLRIVDAAARRQAGTGPGSGRAAVKQAEAAVGARLADLGLARAELFPSLSLRSRYEVVDYPSNVWFDREADDWRTNFSVMVVASYPVFTGFRRTADLGAARARVAASRTRVAETAELARLADLEAEEDVGRAQAVLRQSQRTVEQANRAYAAAEARYENGVATHLDLVDARVVLQRARVDQARAARDLRVATVRRAVLPGLPVTLPATLAVTTESEGTETTAPP